MSWRYVPQRNTRNTSHARNALRQVSSDTAANHSPLDKDVDPAHISSVVRRMRRISENLKRTPSIINDVFDPLESFLEARAHRTDTVCVTALGVGEFAGDSGSIGSLLQMALFLAIVDRCRHATNTSSRILSEEPSKGDVCSSPSQNTQGYQKSRRKVRVHATFYDPIVTPREKLCCSKVDVRCGDTSGSALYASSTPNSLTVLFMPHCPWVLFHNVFAANWPSSRPDKESTVWCALENLVIIGNNVGDVPPIKPPLCFVQLLPALECSAVSLSSRRKRRRGMRNALTGESALESTLGCNDTPKTRAVLPEEADKDRSLAPNCTSKRVKTIGVAPTDDNEDVDGGIHVPGVGMRDVELAFSDMSFTRLSPHWSIAKLQELVAKVPVPAPRADGLELS